MLSFIGKSLKQLKNYCKKYDFSEMLF